MDIKVGEYIERTEPNTKVFVTKITDTGIKGISKTDPNGTEIFIPNNALDAYWRLSPKWVPPKMPSQMRQARETFKEDYTKFCLELLNLGLETRDFTEAKTLYDGNEDILNDDLSSLIQSGSLSEDSVKEVKKGMRKLPNTSEFTANDWDIIYRSLKDHYENHVGLRDHEREDTETLIKVLEEAGYKEE